MPRFDELPDGTGSLSDNDLIAVLDAESDTTKQATLLELSDHPPTTRWEDLRVAVISTNAAGSKPPTLTRVYRDTGGTSQGVFTYGFSAAQEQEIYFEIQLPHGWVAGSEVRPHVHWVHQEASVPGNTNVRWGLEYLWANAVNAPDNVYGTTSTIYADETVTAARDTHLISPFTAVSGTGKRLSSVALCRLFRDVANDNFAGEAFGLSVDFHIQVNSFGSVAEYPS